MSHIAACSLGGREVARAGRPTLPGEFNANQYSNPFEPKSQPLWQRTSRSWRIPSGCGCGAAAPRTRRLCDQFRCQPKANAWGGKEQLMFADLTWPWPSFPSLLLRAAAFQQTEHRPRVGWLGCPPGPASRYLAHLGPRAPGWTVRLSGPRGPREETAPPKTFVFIKQRPGTTRRARGLCGLLVTIRSSISARNLPLSIFAAAGPQSPATRHARPPRGSPKPHQGAPFARRSRPGCNSGGRGGLPLARGGAGRGSRPCSPPTPSPRGRYTAAPALRPAAARLRAPLAPRPRASRSASAPRGGDKFAPGRPAPPPPRSSCTSAPGRAGRGP